MKVLERCGQASLVGRTVSRGSRLLMLFSLCLATKASAASGNPTDCPGPSIRVDSELPSSWLDSVRAVRARLALDSSVDPCVEILITPAQAGATVSVSLPDGRRASRHVATPEALGSVLESLVLLPAQPASDAPKRFPEAKYSAGTTSLDSGRPEPTLEPRAGAADANPQRVSLEIGVGPTFALSFTPSYFGYGLGGHAVVSLNDWLVQSQLRWHVEDRGTGQALPSGFGMQQLQFGAGVGRRFHAPGLLLDLILHAEAVVIDQEAYGDDPEGLGGSYGDLALGLSLRLATPRQAATRFYAELGLDAYPRRIGRAQRVDEALPALPASAVTTALGASWSAW